MYDRPPIWNYYDSAPAPTTRQALAFARRGQLPASASERARYVRSWLALTLQAGMISNWAPRVTPEAPAVYGAFGPGMYRSKDELDIASTVLRTTMLLLPKGRHKVGDIETRDGEPAIVKGDLGSFDVGIPPLLAVAAYSLVAMASVAIAYMGAEVIDRHLQRQDDTKRLLSSQANAVGVLGQHLAEEGKAGKKLPWTPQELAVMEQLWQTQRDISKKEERSFPNPFVGASNGVGKILGDIGSGLGSALPLAAVAAGLYFVTR